MITLTTGSNFEKSTVLAPIEKAQISAAVQGDVSAVSDEQVREALAGQPEAIVEK